MNALFPLVLLSLASLNLQAETYKCQQGGKTVIADVPCMAGAPRVDRSADQVELSRKRQAELVHSQNQSQLSELEYRAAQDRRVKGGFNVIDSMNPGEIAKPRRRDAR